MFAADYTVLIEPTYLTWIMCHPYGKHHQHMVNTISSSFSKHTPVVPIIHLNWYSVRSGNFYRHRLILWYFFISLINSLAPGKPRCHFETAIFNLVLLIGIFTPSKDDALRWMPRDLTDDKSTLIQIMAWCRYTTSHYLSQCWPSSMSPYGVTRPQWVKTY